MRDKVIFVLTFLVIIMQERQVKATGDELNSSEPTKPSQLKPLENFVFNQKVHNGSKDNTENVMRVKRQYPYDDRGRYYPLPIIVGGLGYPVFGPWGYGGRGFGGRGFGGRGFGGRGFGGRGFGGRGIGGRGIGGRGVGGGRGGRG